MQGDLYDVGDLVRLAFTFVNASNVPTDPSSVTVQVKAPDGTVTTATYLAAQVVRDSAGQYHYDVSVDQAGTWRYRGSSTGTGQAAVEDRFDVRQSEF